MSAAATLPRVCILTDSFYPIVGGGENHARLLGREMVRRGAKVLVVTRRRDPASAPRELLDGYPVHRVPPTGWPRLGKYLMMPPALLRLHKLRDQYDVVYVCGLRVLGVLGIFAHRWGKVCVLRSESCGELSGGFIWDSPHGAKRFWKNLLGGVLRARNRYLFRADAFVSISDAIRREFIAAGVAPAAIHSITNGIDTDLFRPVSNDRRRALRRQLNLPDGVIFAYSGKLNRGKGLLFLLCVWRRFVAQRGNAHLLLIGSGGLQFLSCEDELKAYVNEHGMGNSVTFTGYVENVHEYLQASDFFVFPSENEALGISLIEALSCELPAVASRIGGIVDIITDGESGRLAAINAEEEWLSILNAFMDQPEAARALGRRGRTVALERFGIGHVTDQHLALFNQLTDRTS